MSLDFRLYKGRPEKLIVIHTVLKQYDVNFNNLVFTCKNVLVDTGCQGTIMSKNTLLQSKFLSEPSTEIIKVINGAKQGMGFVNRVVRCNIQVGNTVVTDCEILVMDVDLNYDLILGLDICQIIGPVKSGIGFRSTETISFNLIRMQPTMKTIARCSLNHKTCNFDCDTEVCKTKICGHQVYESNRFFHFGPINRDEYLKPGQNEIECGIIFDEVSKVIDDDEDLFFRINWKVANDIYITKIAKINQNSENPRTPPKTVPRHQKTSKACL